mgnify:CR=1 FL=1
MNIIPVFPLDITATTTAGYLARREQRFAIDENTIEWLFACRTGVPEITNVIQLVCKYIFNGTIEVNGQPGHVLHKVCNFRSTGEAILEQLLVYSFCFISFNPTTSEPVVWDLHDLTVQMERSMYGEITMYARPRFISELHNHEDWPRFICISARPPANGQPMSCLTLLKPYIALLQPSILAGFVGQLRETNPTLFFGQDNTSTSVAVRDTLAFGDARANALHRKQEAHRDATDFAHGMNATQADANKSILHAVSLSSAIPFNHHDPSFHQLSNAVMNGVTQSPVVTVTPPFTMVRGPVAKSDIGMAEFIRNCVRQMIAEAFGIVTDVFSTDGQAYKNQATSGLSWHFMEAYMDLYTSYVTFSIEQMFKYCTTVTKHQELVIDESKSPGIRTVITRKQPLEKVMMLQPFLKEDVFINLMAAAVGLNPEDFEIQKPDDEGEVAKKKPRSSGAADGKMSSMSSAAVSSLNKK